MAALSCLRGGPVKLGKRLRELVNSGGAIALISCTRVIFAFSFLIRNSSLQKMQYKWTALTVTTVGTLMAGLDSRILVIGLPTIAKQLHASAEETVWFSQSFLLSSTVALLLIGRFSDLYGKVRIYNIGFIIFTFGSALSSISFDPQELIAFRAVQGIGAAILLANSTAIVTDSSPAKELGMMIGINQTALRSGAMAGLTLSGVILSITDWRGLFYVNIPIGIFGTVWAYLRLREISKNPEARKIDWIGFLLFS